MPDLPDVQTTDKSHRRLVIKLLAGVALSFAFGFALVPLYDVFCEVTGLNGKTAGPGGFGIGGIINPGAPSSASRIDKDRVVTVEFTDTVMPGLPWEISPQTARLDVHPGELHQVMYRVRNLSDQPIVGQAVPSVSPGQAAASFEKLECFCFSQQALAPGESKDLPLLFTVKNSIDKDIHTITLAYAFFNVTDPKSAAKLALP